MTVPTTDPFAAKTFLVGIFVGIFLGALLMERMWFLITRYPWGTLRPKRRDRRGTWS